METFLRTVHWRPEPAPRTRDPSKPMRVICVGPPRSGTESLATALKILDIEAYHGWDIIFERPTRLREWVRLAEKKLYKDSMITSDDFDAVVGHAEAVVDAPGSVFAAEMIAAYPEAKVILNYRKDMDAWHRSAVNNIVRNDESWLTKFCSKWTFIGYWTYLCFDHRFWAILFRATCGMTTGQAIRLHGKAVYREHCAMIRGFVPKERLLEWSVEDGWEPLCKFLDKDVPKEPFPRTNDRAGFDARINELWRSEISKFVIVTGCIAAVGVSLYSLL